MEKPEFNNISSLSDHLNLAAITGMVQKDRRDRGSAMELNDKVLPPCCHTAQILKMLDFFPPVISYNGNLPVKHATTTVRKRP